MTNGTQDDYELLDTGNGLKLERFGQYRIVRPAAQAVWLPHRPETVWNQANARFARSEGQGWDPRRALPSDWQIQCGGVQFKLMPTDFGHLGVFPEHATLWPWMGQVFQSFKKNHGRTPSILNLFAYSGGASLYAAQQGCEVCHLDASKGMVDWARENAALNGLADKPIRWIVDDVTGFLQREARRGRSYDGIILDPPSFGRGKKGQIYKIENDLLPTLDLCQALLSDTPAFLLLTCHTPGYTPTVLNNILDQRFAKSKGQIQSGELMLGGSKDAYSLPSGTYSRWNAEGLGVAS